MAWHYVLKCDTCGEEIGMGPGAMGRADDHERKASGTSATLDGYPETHWVQLIQVENDTPLPIEVL